MQHICGTQNGTDTHSLLVTRTTIYGVTQFTPPTPSKAQHGASIRCTSVRTAACASTRACERWCLVHLRLRKPERAPAPHPPAGEALERELLAHRAFRRLQDRGCVPCHAPRPWLSLALGRCEAVRSAMVTHAVARALGRSSQLAWCKPLQKPAWSSHTTFTTHTH